MEQKTGLRSCPELGILGIPELAELPAENGFGDVEVVPAMEVDVVVDKRRETLHILWSNVEALGNEMRKGRVDVPGIPENDDVDGKAELSELVFLPLAIALP